MSTQANRLKDPAGVWKVTNRESGNHLYLAGTSHLLNEKDLPLPSPYYAAYNNSDLLVVESKEDGAGLISDTKMMAWALKNRKAIFGNLEFERQLDEQTREKLKQFFDDAYQDEVADSTPFLVSLGIMSKVYDTHGGVESVFEELARKEKKKISELDGSGLNKITMQTLDLWLEQFNQECADKGIDKTLEQYLTSMTSEPLLDEAHRKGDRDQMKAVLENDKEELGELYVPLVVDRNKEWLPKLANMVSARSPETEYVLVGASHLAGDTGILSLLEAKGYVVEPLYGVDQPKLPE